MLSLGPDLFARLNAEQCRPKSRPVLFGAAGLPVAEINAIEIALGFHLPPDFAYLLQHVQDPGAILFPWRNFRKADYDQSIAWIVSGLEFDIRENNLWLHRWGPRPAALAEAIEIARQDFASWPRLLPILGHRFLAADPCLADNPVFSIVQTDIVYYGQNLAQYLVNEFIKQDWVHEPRGQEIRHIDVWSDFAEDPDRLRIS
jgi:hypothetical protein